MEKIKHLVVYENTHKQIKMLAALNSTTIKDYLESLVDKEIAANNEKEKR